MRASPEPGEEAPPWSRAPGRLGAGAVPAVSRAGNKRSRLRKRRSQVSVFPVGAWFFPDQDGAPVCAGIAGRHPQPRSGSFTFFVRRDASDTRGPRNHGQPPPPRRRPGAQGVPGGVGFMTTGRDVQPLTRARGEQLLTTGWSQKLGGLVLGVGTPWIGPRRVELGSD